MIRIELPGHLRTLAQVQGEVTLELAAPATLGSAIAALEERFPVLKGAIRDHGTLKRRAFVRFFVCGEDYSLRPPETLLPDAIVTGREPLMVVGAVAGG